VLPASNREWALSVAILMCMICLSVLSKLPAPKAIEAAQNATDLQKQMVTWGPAGCARLGFSLGFDYLFMAAYVTAIGLGCAMVADRARNWLHLLGMILAFAQTAGGLIDATENASLIRLLLGGFDQGLMSIARLATASKFAIPLAGIAYILIAWPISRWGKV
jgi:hypothetical protein